MDRPPEVTGQQAPSLRPPWPEPCARWARQAQGQPAPRYLRLRPPTAVPLSAFLLPLRTECASKLPIWTCVWKPSNLVGSPKPISRVLEGSPQPPRPWEPNQERAEGLASDTRHGWLRGSSDPAPAPGVQPSLNKVSSRTPKRRPRTGCWGPRPCPPGGFVARGLRECVGRGAGTTALVLRSKWDSRPGPVGSDPAGQAWPCPLHTFPCRSAQALLSRMS